MSKKTDLDDLLLTVRSACNSILEVVCQNELQDATTEQLMTELFARTGIDTSFALRLSDRHAELLLSRLLERDWNNGMKNVILEYVLNKTSVNEVCQHINNAELLKAAIERNTNYEILKALAEEFKTR